MPTIPETVIGYSEYAAQEFLQTAVFVDDRIYERKDGSVAGVKKVIPPKKRKQAVRLVADSEQSEEAATIGNDEEEYSPHDIVTSFAKKQIICSLYQPNRGASVSPASDIFPLCRAADIAIVDWDLYGDRGENALKLIDGLIQQAVRDIPEQLRLILVYTQEINLFKIADQLYEKVTAGIGDVLEPVLEEGGLAFRTLNSRVSILGKAGRERPNVSSEHVVEEKDLANTAVKEFAKLADGLLHAATLLGLAKIKKNSRKILSKFDKKLDPAFLTHLAMSLSREDASEHITPLLVSEIEAVLQDVLPRPLIPEALRRDWCQNTWQPGDHLDELFGQNDLDKRAIAEAICVQGFKAAKSQFDQVPNPDSSKNISKNTRKAAKVLLPSNDDDANYRFARLMASRTFYEDAAPKQKVLKLGSIVNRKKDDKYLLCIQPVCDSIGLESGTAFLFVELERVVSDSDGPVSHIVVQEENEFVELYYQLKSYRCWSATFVPDAKTKQVEAKLSTDHKVFFKDKSQCCYEWVDELKMAHAQRAVEKFARDLSRVGLTESEWLRRLDR